MQRQSPSGFTLRTPVCDCFTRLATLSAGPQFARCAWRTRDIDQAVLAWLATPARDEAQFDALLARMKQARQAWMMSG